MIATNFTPFMSPGDYLQLSGVSGFMNDMVCQVAVVHDESHVEICRQIHSVVARLGNAGESV